MPANRPIRVPPCAMRLHSAAPATAALLFALTACASDGPGDDGPPDGQHPSRAGSSAASAGSPAPEQSSPTSLAATARTPAADAATASEDDARESADDAPDAGGTPALDDECAGPPLSVRRECISDEECTSGWRQACCGDTVVIGLNVDSAEAFERNKRCAAPCGPLGCQGGGLVAEDGRPLGGDGVGVRCEQGECRTVGTPTCIGGTTCASDQICYQLTGGMPSPGDSQPSSGFGCQSSPPACTRDCSCYTDRLDCSCSIEQGTVHLACSAP